MPLSAAENVAVGAFGGVAINLGLRQSYASTGEATSALWLFLAYYLMAAVLTWQVYVRRPAAGRATAEADSTAALL